MRRFIFKGAVVGADQLLIAAAQLLTNFLLARWLAIDSFGAWSIAISGVSILGAVFQTVLIDNFIVRWSKAKSNRAKDTYVDVVAFLYLSVFVFFLLFAVFFVYVFDLPIYWVGIIAGEIAFSAFLSARRYLTAIRLFGRLLLTSAAYAFLIVLALISLKNFSFFDLNSIAVARALVLLICVGIAVRFSSSFSVVNFKRLIKLASLLTLYSSPQIVGAMVFWATTSVQVIFIGLFEGDEAAAGFRVVGLFMLPFAIFFSAVFNLLISKYVVTEVGDKLVSQVKVLLVIPAAIYVVIIWFLSKFLVFMLFGEAYLPYVWMLNVMVLGAIVDAIKQLCVFDMYKYEYRDLFLKYRIGCLLLFVAVSVPAFYIFGLSGYVISLVFTNALSVFVLSLMVSKYAVKES